MFGILLGALLTSFFQSGCPATSVPVSYAKNGDHKESTETPTFGTTLYETTVPAEHERDDGAGNVHSVMMSFMVIIIAILLK